LWIIKIVVIVVVVRSRRWCSGNINAFQAFALGSIPGRRRDILFMQHNCV
jgi:membrane glycosyltransferase